MKMIVLSILASGIFGSPAKENNYDAWQFSVGKQIYRQRDFWEIGLNKYQIKNNLFYKLGGEFQYNHNESENSIDLNQMVKYLSIRANSSGYYVTKYWNDHHFRIKPYIEFGYKFIRRKKYSSDISLPVGIGLNIYRNFEHHYYFLDSNLYPINSLVVRSGTYEEYSFLQRPEFFFAIRNTHYFKITTKSDLFFDYSIGFNFGIYQNSKYNYNNGFCLQFRIGYSLSS